MKLDEFKQGLSSFWESVSEGWQHLRQSASSAITGFQPSAQTNLPEKDEIDDAYFKQSRGWSMLGGDLFEDDRRVVVRLEVPGMDKNDLDLEVVGDTLVVHGEKRFEREESAGRNRMLQCAYGSFRRAITLPAPVVIEQASASYRNGVLRVELPKQAEQAPSRKTVRID